MAFRPEFFFFDYFEEASPIQLRRKSSVSLSRLDSVEYTETFFFFVTATRSFSLVRESPWLM